MSVVPPLPMLAASIVVEGPARIGLALRTAFSVDAIPALAGLLFVIVVGTLLGFGIWNALLARYSSSSVAPLSMVVPIVGIVSSWAMFGERIDAVCQGPAGLDSRRSRRRCSSDKRRSCRLTSAGCLAWMPAQHSRATTTLIPTSRRISSSQRAATRAPRGTDSRRRSAARPDICPSFIQLS